MNHIRKRFSIRRLLQREGQDIPRGIISNMSRDLGIHANTMGKYFSGNDLQSVSLEHLTKISDYLKREKGVGTNLPGGLLYDDSLWDVWRDLRTTFFLGFHTTEDAENVYDRWISPNDHHAQSSLAAHLSQQQQHPNLLSEMYVEFDRGGDRDSQRAIECETRRTFEEFFPDLTAILYPHGEGKWNRVLTANCLIGSQKVNGLLNYFVASLYNHANPLKVSDTPTIPFYVVPRPTDHKFISCFGGKEIPPFLPRTDPAPGIYYYDEMRRSWDNFVAWIPGSDNDGGQDAGMVIIRQGGDNDVLDLAIFGFGGRGTLALATYVITHGEEFWDLDSLENLEEERCPKDQVKKIGNIGAFVCKIPLPIRDDRRPESALKYRDLQIEAVKLPIAVRDGTADA